MIIKVLIKKPSKLIKSFTNLSLVFADGSMVVVYFFPGSILEVPLACEGLGCTASGHRVKVKTGQMS